MRVKEKEKLIDLQERTAIVRERKNIEVYQDKQKKPKQRDENFSSKLNTQEDQTRRSVDTLGEGNNKTTVVQHVNKPQELDYFARSMISLQQEMETEQRSLLSGAGLPSIGEDTQILDRFKLTIQKNYSGLSDQSTDNPHLLQLAKVLDNAVSELEKSLGDNLDVCLVNLKKLGEISCLLEICHQFFIVS
eukprot:TRINITY_DN4030_c0_g1_i2.p1 TRINITY_DN4030_c0_g1~~TRINITY_DN4030_c0_g1_i2.p1  ORF type:complete len:190 (-),score=34.91 TRINITY_DN4030_c0_g1_i2:230-799(-)